MRILSEGRCTAGSQEWRVMQRPISIADLRVLARRRLPKAVFDFIDGGSEDERTLYDNEAAMDEWNLTPRVGVDVSRRDMHVTLVGKASRLPLFLAPTGLAGFFRPGGEIAAARAAARAGIPFCLSTNSVASLEEVARAVPEADLWFQLYPLRDKSLMSALIKRAQDARYRVLCLTVDLPLLARRERDLRNSFSMPLRLRPRTVLDLCSRPRWLLGAARNPPRFGNFTQGSGGFRNVAQHVATLFDPAADWSDFARLRESWQGPIVIKGILHPADAEKAVGIGAEAIVVSNHGGRQLDDAPTSLSALPEIATAVNGRAQVFMDGGIRRGSDIAKAIGLGASACGIGRPFLWGLAAAGEIGVEWAIAILGEELDCVLALLGTPRLADISRDHVRPRHR